MENWMVTVFEVPPPGGGFTTFICTVPLAGTSAVVIANVSVVELTNVVTFAVLFQWTVEDEMKPVPMTRKIRLDPEAPASCKSVITGVGLVDGVVVAGGVVGVLLDVLPPPPPQLVQPSTMKINAAENVRRRMWQPSKGKEGTTLMLTD